MGDVNVWLARARALVTAVSAWLVAAAAVLTAAAGEIAELAPPGSEGVVAWLLRAAAVLAGAVGVVRRGMPVPSELRGLVLDDRVEERGWTASDGGRVLFTARGALPATGSSAETTRYRMR